ncbi:MAG: hypothetical protein LLG20_23335 [Acidobacteriales bacterium]|nr:hypothetical protein [Terriglobales bacterium]
MPDNPLSCRQAQAMIRAAQTGPELAAHLAECDDCLSQMLSFATQTDVPPGFAARAAVRIEKDLRHGELRVSYWALATACVLFAVLTGWAAATGAFTPLLSRLPSQPPNITVLAAIGCIEAALIFGWLWRLSKA